MDPRIRNFLSLRVFVKGTPLSPFLFIISMEVLNVIFIATCKLSLFYGIRIPNNNVSISHLFYADETIFMGDWDKGNPRNLACIIVCFHVSYGLKVNFHKSKVFGIEVLDKGIVNCARILECDVTLSYLIFGGPNRFQHGSQMKLEAEVEYLASSIQVFILQI